MSEETEVIPHNLTRAWALEQRQKFMQDLETQLLPLIPRMVDQIIYALGASERADVPYEMVRVEYSWPGKDAEELLDLPLSAIHGEKRVWECLSELLIEELERRGFADCWEWDDDVLEVNVYPLPEDDDE